MANIVKENKMNYLKKLFLPVVLFLICGQAVAQLKKPPADISAAMLIKVADFEKKISDGRDVSIYVLGAPEVAAELRKGIGRSIGKSVLRSVEAGSDLPATTPSILYVDASARVSEVIGYTRRNKILSATGNPDLVGKGITLGFGVGKDGKMKILLNSTSSGEEGLEWNPAIFKIAKMVQ